MDLPEAMKPNFISEDEFAAMTKRVGFVEQLETKHISRDGVKKHTRVGAGGGGAVTERPATGTSVKSGARTSHATIKLVLTGQLVSGKNQVQLSFKNGKVHKYPNKTFSNWRAAAHRQIFEQVELTLIRDPIYSVPVRLTVEYWPGDARTRDVSGQLDALFHLLVYAKVLKDDGLVHDVIWKRQAMNRKFPKVLMTVEVL